MKKPRDNGFDGILVVGWLHDEPEEHVGHVDDPDGLSGENVKLALIRMFGGKLTP